MTWLSEIENKLMREPCFPVWDVTRMARVIRELAGYITFLEAYCSDRMSTEKARRRFQVPDDVKELLS